MSTSSPRIGTTQILVGTLLSLALLAADNIQAADRPPNIIFLLIDDMGWGDIGCFGHAFHETPHIDAFAADGMKFTDFYAATPVCSSTRSTIQTGQYSARTGITDFIAGHWRRHAKLIVPPIDHHLQPGIRTPGHVLGAAGYTTAYFGKWHLGNGPDHHPDQWGYDFTENQLGAQFRQGRGEKPVGPKRIDLLTDQTLYFIERHQDRPFFVTLSHHAVHIPLEAEPETIAKYRSKPTPKSGVNNVVYAAMIEDLDRSIGRILQRIDDLGLRQDTIIVFTSDNGGLRKIYTGVGEVVSTNAPLRDEKGSLYEGGIRVPLIVRWPGVVQPGTTSGVPATTADLLPTFCEMTGSPLPEQRVDGRSLVPVLQGDRSLERAAIYFHYPHYHHSLPAGAIRMGDWKLIEFFEDGRLELYNLAGDLGETTNLAGLHPTRAQRMQQRLAQWREQVNARMPTPNPEYDPERAKVWWNRRTNRPLDVEAMRRRYESRQQAGSARK